MTYDEIAARFTLRLCGGCGAQVNHQAGQYDGLRIHWSPRRVTRPGLRRFLKLAVASWLGMTTTPELLKTFWTSYLADVLASELHVRFPRRYSELDRARVRSAMVGANLDPETRRLMERWAKA